MTIKASLPVQSATATRLPLVWSTERKETKPTLSWCAPMTRSLRVIRTSPSRLPLSLLLLKSCRFANNLERGRPPFHTCALRMSVPMTLLPFAAVSRCMVCMYGCDFWLAVTYTNMSCMDKHIP